MEDFKIDKNVIFNNVYISEAIFHDTVDGIINISDHIKEIFYNTNKNYAELCYRLNELKIEYGEKLHSVNGSYVDFYEYCEKAFGLAKKTVCKYIQAYHRFCCLAGETVRFSTAFEDFNISKLFELLPVSDKQLLEDIKNNRLFSSMSKKRIREYVKSLKGGENEENKVLEEPKNLDEQEAELDMAFNPKQEYDYEYYKSKSKADLIGYCIDLQRLVQKLLNKKK